MSYLDEAVIQTGRWEGRIAWLYRDTRGNITVAMGKMLPTLKAAQALPLCITAPNERATGDEIAVDWARLQAMPFGQKYAAVFYRGMASVFLMEKDITALATDSMSACDGELAVDYRNYDSLPDCVKVALLDMDYNLGEPKLRTKYPHFDAAIDSRDWVAAAANCHRNGISEERNLWTARQFQQALALG